MLLNSSTHQINDFNNNNHHLKYIFINNGRWSLKIALKEKTTSNEDVYKTENKIQIEITFALFPLAWP